MISKFILAFMAFFAIMNPISNLPAFMALVADDDQKISRRIAAKGVLLAFVIIVIFVLSGHLLFNLFGITLAALKISGGILVGIIGYKMINGIHSPTNKNLEEHKDDPMNVAVSPLAMPLLAGPGTIATAMGLSSGGLSGKLITILAFAILCVIMYVILISANEITKFLWKKCNDYNHQNDGTYFDDYRDRDANNRHKNWFSFNIAYPLWLTFKR
ncbi:integral membrane protein of the MarC family [Streptococcus agalactiae 18RS21]|nr:integral membrane protein of the MarC family [Streptococcus agalactiae 18RS21]